MNFTGTELIHNRNFYTQNNNFEFWVNCYVDNLTGNYTFGITGNNGSFQVNLSGGKIYKDGIFIHHYSNSEIFTLKSQITSGNYNIYKNDMPLILGGNKSTGDFDNFFFSRQYNMDGAQFDVYISGYNIPNIFIQNSQYLLNSGQNIITGEIINNGPYLYQIFDNISNITQNLTFIPFTGILNSSQTGYFYYSGDIIDIDFSQPIPINFYTNYDYPLINFYITNLSSLSYYVLLQPISDYSFNSQNQINRTLTYSNYSGGIISNNFNTDIIFELNYVSGSGSYVISNFANSGFYNITGYGNFLRNGYITGQSNVQTGNSSITGSYIINVSSFAWATGASTGFFSGIGMGIATGIDYTGLAIGSFTGLATGLIYNGSGTLLYNGQATGYGLISQSVNYQSYINATGFLNISGLTYRDLFYVGIDNIPIVKGLQFNNETGLIYYFSGNSQHKVSSYISGELIYLTSLYNGENGNGIFIHEGDCNIGQLIYSPFLTGGTGIGSTGITVYPISTYTGIISTIITGSGNYYGILSGNAPGEFLYTRTFTGVWDLLTGTSENTLVSLKSLGNYNQTMISGQGTLPPNSSINFQINHNDVEFNIDEVNLIISGTNIINPISQNILQ